MALFTVMENGVISMLKCISVKHISSGNHTVDCHLLVEQNHFSEHAEALLVTHKKMIVKTAMPIGRNTTEQESDRTRQRFK